MSSIFFQALNPDNQLKKGQTVRLTCDVLVEGVRKKNIVWKLNGEKITDGISRNRWDRVSEFHSPQSHDKFGRDIHLPYWS
jgi:hypothetical protein